MKKIYLIAISIIFIISCKSDRDIENVINVTIDQNNPKIKLVLVVKLLERIDKKQLEEISEKLYHKYNAEDYENVFFTFYLYDMEIGNGSYARAQYNPKRIEILGITQKEKEQIISNFKIKEPFWIDDFSQIILQKQKENNQHYMKKYAADLSNGKELLIRSVKDTDTIYKISDAEDGAYYLINSNDELSIFDNQGYINKFLKN